MPTADRDTLTVAALALAGRGWHVFPLQPGSKVPALRSDWEGRATVDRDRIVRCWAAGCWNIGVAAGPSALVVVDLDMPKPGETPPDQWALLGITCGADVFAELAARARQPVPQTFTVATPSGGRHLYFTAPHGYQLRNTAGRLGWRIDTRAHGGYVVGPGSITLDGAYTIMDDRPPTGLPAWLTLPVAVSPGPSPSGTRDLGSTAVSAPAQIAVTSADRYLRSALNQEINRVQHAPRGQHNAALFGATLTLGRLVAGGALAEHTVRAALLDAFRAHIDNPACDCTEAQARRTITSGLGYGAQRPRHVPATHDTTHPPKGSAA